MLSFEDVQTGMTTPPITIEVFDSQIKVLKKIELSNSTAIKPPSFTNPFLDLSKVNLKSSIETVPNVVPPPPGINIKSTGSSFKDKGPTHEIKYSPTFINSSRLALDILKPCVMQLSKKITQKFYMSKRGRDYNIYALLFENNQETGSLLGLHIKRLKNNSQLLKVNTLTLGSYQKANKMTEMQFNIWKKKLSIVYLD